MTRTACVIIVSLFLCVWPLFCQIGLEKNFKTLPLGHDTLCFRYAFATGDTLAYIVDSQDSINMEGQPTLTKSRSELVLIICDTALPNSQYRLRYRLQSCKERQTNSRDSSVRSTSPWMGRDAVVVIDSLGDRLITALDDPHRLAVTPGGAFQPLLIPSLGQSCGRQNESWMVDDTTALVENGVPSPVFKYQTLWRVLDKADTLGRKFLQIQYTQTGIGAMDVASNDVNLQLKAKIAAYGKLSMDVLLKVPYHLFATSENKLTISAPDGKEREGKHQVVVHAQLVEIRSPNPERRFRIRLEP